MGRTADARDTVIELERRAADARVDVAALRRERAAVRAEADRRVAELEALDDAAAGPFLRLAALALLLILVFALGLAGIAS
jgi:hypothetical protein